MTDFPPALVAWLHEELHASAAITAALLPSRSENRSYRLTVGETSYVLKLIHPRRATAVAHELAIVPYLHARGFPVPSVLAIAPDLPDIPERAVLRTHLDGTPASERFPTLDAAARAGLLAAMGELLARIHSLPLAAVYAFWQYPEDTVHTPADWATNFVQKKVASDLAVLTPSGALAANIVADMQERLTHWAASLAAAPVTLAPLHGDFYLDNVLVTEDGAIAGLLDWEAARLGDPLWELARTQVASFGDAPAEYARFHDAYCRHIPLAIDEGRMTRYCFLMAMGDLRYAIRHAPELTTERAAYVTCYWRQLRKAPGWS